MTNAELDDRLGELLIGYNTVSAAHVDRARAYQRAKECTLAGALCELHLVQPDTLRPLLEELTGIRAFDPSLMTVYPDFIERMNALIPPDVVQALQVLRARLYEIEREKVDSERSAARKGQIGTGDRSERIRTYNFPQARVTDHRINLTLYKLEEIMSGVALDQVIEPLITEHQAELLAAEGE